MRKARLEHRVVIGAGAFEPLEKRLHLLPEPSRGRSLIVDTLASERPDTTCIGSVLSSRQAPTRILRMPLRPVGNSDACQAKSLSAVSACL